MKILPVLDILNQTVVRGVAGQRDNYQSIQSRLTESNQPLDIARALRDEFQISEFYVADLDAIVHGKLNLDLYQNLLDNEFTFLLDCGLRYAADSQPLTSLPGISVVAGLETLAGPQELGQLVEQWGSQQTAFSLDLKQGQPLVSDVPHNEYALIKDPLKIAELSLSQGIQQMILLDLAQVGTGKGTGTEELCYTVRSRYPELRLITGGGIQNCNDLMAQAKLGADAVLVASALHDGRIDREAVLSLI
ncbi:HisA/HisF-related TIM barrel protein [Gimesia aquarii]|uniref:1-(5-phosphoribosyl)-5-[(5-phosphoribosylamino)methylideneamino] imidazole-4-carboxamide isomerase n=1 Tax=Gimesia aquarii TaxID=2527964 RepID=A0A517WUP3_9PLAN|nr:HisA/HisF-related TIM barrel protein [Gimesia aquarii]QDU08979.1 1-(5-phosphoribosyl)-5-[(5-phosphoribosylamino)methylideneamino] imidazole-4-carboxamide isomerase [Gimesia aquarii]